MVTVAGRGGRRELPRPGGRRPTTVEAETLAAAHDLADRLRSRAFVLTRENTRVATARAIQAGLDADMAAFEVES